MCFPGVVLCVGHSLRFYKNPDKTWEISVSIYCLYSSSLVSGAACYTEMFFLNTVLASSRTTNDFLSCSHLRAVLFCMPLAFLEMTTGAKGCVGIWFWCVVGRTISAPSYYIFNSFSTFRQTTRSTTYSPWVPTSFNSLSLWRSILLGCIRFSDVLVGLLWFVDTTLKIS